MATSHVWECSRCRELHPDLPSECWQFANETGECPRCLGRIAASEEDNQ